MDEISYGTVIITDNTPIITQAPEYTLAHPNIFASSRVSWRGNDIFFLGNDPQGIPVQYQILGWHTEQKALICKKVHV